MFVNPPDANNGDPFVAPLPKSQTTFPRGLFDTLPEFEISAGEINSGYSALADRIVAAMPHGLRVLAIDGFHGTDWAAFRSGIDAQLAKHNIFPEWWDVRDCLLPAEVIREKITPFLGGNDPLWGTHFPMGPDVFFDAEKIAKNRILAAMARGEASGKLTVFYGCGAGLVELFDQIWYIDVPKDEIQFRARRKEITCLGETENLPFGDFYKRTYFVDWPALNRHKRMLLPEIDCFIDLTDSAKPTAISGSDLRTALRELAETPFRPRPWFYPGPWGGKYMQGHMGLDPEQPNFAWSFEMIVPENGVTIAKNGVQLEFSFDCLLYQENRRVMGAAAAQQFKFEWPIRLDYLDTIDGGNLSTQCHPRPNFMRQNFGETYTQDETYYISNAKPDAKVYLGLTENCDPAEFRAALETSHRNGTELDFDKFVNSEPAKPHDLFLIPNGTVHCSGTGNLVLEISATPYIFTFKIYDYLRKDLEGNLRPMNIERAFENIYFDRRKNWVQENLLAKPQLLREGDGWREEVLYDKPFTFYNVHRAEFEREFEFDTADRGFAVNLVEGESVEIWGENGRKMPLKYLESMLIPAACGRVKIVNRGDRPCKMVLVFVRPTVGVSEPLNSPSD